MDRRQHNRFDLSAPVTYSWEQGSIRSAGRGTTRDVSECGLFVLTESSPPLGAVIEFEVSFSFRDDSQIQMRAKGKVIRVDADGTAKAVHGFAAATKVLWLYNPALSSAGGMNAEVS